MRYALANWLENLNILDLRWSLRIVCFTVFAGEYQIGYNIKPLDPSKVGSVVQYGKHIFSLRRKAIGQSVIYNQLYPFEGLQNYTSGIIHHVQLTGMLAETS